MAKKTVLVHSIFLFLIVCVQAQQYPELKYLDHREPLFTQLEKEIIDFYAGKADPDLSLFRYRLPKDTSIFAVAATLSLPVETLVTLNRIHINDPLPAGTEVLICNIPGVFVAEYPSNDLEYLVYSRGMLDLDNVPKIKINQSFQKFTVFFLKGERFNPVELGYFLGVYFRFPVDSKNITSYYGMRESIRDGSPEFHHGIDIGVPVGSKVYAAREGTVVKTGTNPVYGNFVIVAHDNEYQTLYGHLSEILVDYNQKVLSGELIALSGNTGYTSGPHLHFEVRKKGERKDPASVFPNKLR
ncbi:MAG: M23 family metallopeptidase [Spirochaetales bacterium]|nr:M23 family metallopeptidase [Spirochaetales bacterium]